MNKQYKSAPQAPVSNIVCHAIGDRCHGCAHYRGEADTCEYAQAPVSGFDEWWEEFSVEHFQVDNGFDEVDVIAKAAWQAALATHPQSSLHELADELRKEANVVPYDSAETTQVLFRVADQLQAALAAESELRGLAESVLMDVIKEPLIPSFESPGWFELPALGQQSNRYKNALVYCGDTKLIEFDESRELIRLIPPEQERK